MPRRVISLATELFSTSTKLEDADARFLARISDELNSGPLNLPCFPDIMPRIRQALDDPDSSVDDIVRLAGTEPRLAARIIQTASSVVFSPSGRPSPNLKAAVTRLGRHLVQSVTMAFVMQQMKTDAMLRPLSKPLDELWTNSVVVALNCQTLAKKLGVPADKVFLTGLMHGIGHFYILVRAAEPQSGIAYTQLRQDLIAQAHPSIGQRVLLKWGFEDIIATAVAQQHDTQRASLRAADLLDVLIAGIVLAEAALYLQGDLMRTEEVTAFHRIGLSMAQLQAVMRHTEHSFEALRSSLC